MKSQRKTVTAIDLFCGAGGLSLGLQQAGVKIAAGFDFDPACEYPFETNLKADFHLRDVSTVTGAELKRIWGKSDLRLLAGCAPCQPFSSHRRGIDTSQEDNWGLLGHFARLVKSTRPHYVTMENVVRLRKQSVFSEFVSLLEELGYNVDFGVLYGPDFGLPQERRRLVLVASRIGPIKLPSGHLRPEDYISVKDSIGSLSRLKSGESDPKDALHAARSLSPLNLKRIQSSSPGGTWEDWPAELRAECHKKSSGSTFKAFYGRMRWDQPSPTITTQSFNYGTGRFGHPEQDRSITLREAAVLQGFPADYQFVPPSEKPAMAPVGRLIGNAVPPAFGKAVGDTFLS